MEISGNGLKIIKEFEGLKFKSYLCPAGVLTIGYGHTGKDVKPNQEISIEEAESLLIQDAVKFENAVNRLVKVEINQNQFDALVSFTYNLGEGNLGRSTLLKKINEKDFAGAAPEFMNWTKAGGKVLDGLKRRRKSEKELFEKVVL